MKQYDNSALRATTIKYWAGFVHAREQHDVKRVHAFQALKRQGDLSKISDNDVSAAYGGRGWAPTPACYECGARDDGNVLFGPTLDVSLCAACIASADALTTPHVGQQPTPTPSAPVSKPGFLTRLFKGA